MSLRSQGPSTATEKQGWQSWLLADALYFGSDAVQEAGNRQDIEQGLPASARVVRDLEEAEVVKKRRTGTPFRKRLQQTIYFEKWRTGGVSVGADRNPTLVAFFYVRSMR